MRSRCDTGMMELLEQLEPNQPILFGGNRVTHVSAELAEAFTPGDRLVVVAADGALLHIPKAEWDTSQAAVASAYGAFNKMGAVDDAAISRFYDEFALRLSDDSSFKPIQVANDEDVERAKGRGRSTTRLELSEKMRQDMISGLQMWRDIESSRDSVVSQIEHDGWTVEQRRAGLGVVGFVFEGRPNVFADACGVLRSGNTVVFRIGSDALGTAKAIVEHALNPALQAAGLPSGAATLVESAARSAGWALFSDTRLALAVARGSGAAVAQLGAVAQQNGIPVSLHGTGGAWMVTGESCDPSVLTQSVANSLDRKVCNTLNTCCVLRSEADTLIPALLDGLTQAAKARGAEPKLHVAAGSENSHLESWFDATVMIDRAEGQVSEQRAQVIDPDKLGDEWEWENSPEITLVLVDSVSEAIELFNAQSPRFTVSLISDDTAEQDSFWSSIDAPFVGNGFTRWVDGQYALSKPELGLSNWQFGRLFSRGAVLSGDSVYTIRTRVTQTDPTVSR